VDPFVGYTRKIQMESKRVRAMVKVGVKTLMKKNKKPPPNASNIEKRLPMYPVLPWDNRF